MPLIKEFVIFLFVFRVKVRKLQNEYLYEVVAFAQITNEKLENSDLKYRAEFF